MIEISINNENTKDQYIPIELFFAKFVMTIAMHLELYGEFEKGQTIIKYVMNHEEKFNQPWIVFTLGLI